MSSSKVVNSKKSVVNIISSTLRKSKETLPIAQLDQFYESLKEIGALKNHISSFLFYFARHGGAEKAQNMLERAKTEGHVTSDDRWPIYIAAAFAKDGNPQKGLDLVGDKDKLDLEGFGHLVRNMFQFSPGLLWCEQQLAKLYTPKDPFIHSKQFPPSDRFDRERKRKGVRKGEKKVEVEQGREEEEGGEANRNIIEEEKREVEKQVQGAFCALMEGLRRLGQENACWRVFQMMQEKKYFEGKEREITGDAHMYNTILDLVMVRSEMERGMEVVDEMKRKGVKMNALTYNTLMRGWLKEKEPKVCVELYEEMKREGVRPNEITFMQMLSSFRETKQNEGECEWVWREIGVAGMKPTVAMYNIMLEVRRKEKGGVEKCMNLMQEMKKNEVEWDVVTFGIMMRVFVDQGKMSHCERLMEDMRAKKIEIPQSVFNLMITGYEKAKNTKRAEELREEMKN